MNKSFVLYKLIPRVIRREIFNLIARLKYDVIIKSGASGGYKNVYEGKNLINCKAQLRRSYLGYASYISGGCNLKNIEFGRFCSIGQNVTNVFSLHPSEKWVSSHPAFYSLEKQAGFTFTKKQLFAEKEFIDDKNKVQNIIGNDVWIGNDVKIMPGIRIGDGAIIATGSIVTKDVKSYTIVGGIPAKLIRNRFEEEEITYLQKLRWWDRDISWIRKNAILFSDIKTLIEEISI